MRPIIFSFDGRRLAAAAALLVLAGCTAQVRDTEQMLGAAGFVPQPADTPEKQAELAALPPHRLLMQHLRTGGGETTAYVYADPDQCHCIYVGDAKAFQAYQQLAFQKRLADEQLQAAQMAEDASFDWGVWGPGFWGPPPVVVVHERR
jgi:hypothetical protein